MRHKEQVRVRELRLIMTNACQYSCKYCNVYNIKKQGNKKLTKKNSLSLYKVGNESYGLLAPNSSLTPFSSADYKFILSCLRHSFGLEDVTFSGGDPFLYPNISKIINTADSLDLRTTAITKGAPLFSINSSTDAKHLLGRLSRLIVSIDTLNAARHAKMNLPLSSYDEAVKYLPRTLSVIRKMVALGMNIEVNSVLLPPRLFRKSASFNNTRRMIDFCLLHGVKKLKFIELDSSSSLGQPYIETYFSQFIAHGFLSSYKLLKSRHKQLRNSNAINVCAISRLDTTPLEVLAYRTHCPSSFLRNGKRKGCEFKNGGELHLDYLGRSFLCQRDSSFRQVSVYDEVKRRDTEGFKEKITAIDREIRKQTCNF